ncbi:A24 family peptidase [Methylobacterium brachythecii]|uniref:Peptidase n=1 Tax=Methylobacterium brachythecii TaxID=1176177 RepID=A0A7W6F7Z4_9HYPH|nr:prepilin peptidase [Methylobacterium brachythecii]MBB3903875.1 prepilin peptidase CpaA [Methylobacterium brachythecii]GLS42624.1 peptidase [Methylobacterium brachythecii]
MSWVGLVVVFPFLMAYAASSDLLTMLIPNWISLALVAAFAVVVAVSGLGWTEIGWHVGAALLTLSVTFTLFAFGVIGGGDAKLAAATTLWIGMGNMLDYLLVASILGGGLTLLLLAARAHPLPSPLRRLPFAMHLHDGKTGVPYGIALAAAGLAVVPYTALWSDLYRL